MARKKHRSVTAAPAKETAVQEQSAVTGVSTAPHPYPLPQGEGKGRGGPPPPTKSVLLEESVQRSFVEKVVIRLSAWLGSLQVAVLLLALFAVVLFTGVIAESWYDTKVAMDLVYRSWWFTLLLVLLGVNIFFAAAKKAQLRGPEAVGTDLPGKSCGAVVEHWWPWLVVASLFVLLLLEDSPASVIWPSVLGIAVGLSLVLWWVQQHWPMELWWPWKKQQTGFLITHVGLLTLVSGGILTSLGGVDALMVLTDTADSRVQKQVGVKQESPQIVDQDYRNITIQKVGKQGEPGKTEVFPIRTGTLAWRDDGHLTADNPPLAAFLGFLTNPLPRFYSRTLKDGATFEVLNFYPHTRREQFQATPAGERGFPAVKYQLSSEMAPNLPENWVAANLHSLNDKIQQLGPGMIEMLWTVSPQLLNDFLKPPTMAELGKKGNIAVHLGSKEFRLPIDRLDGSPPEELPGTSWKVRVLRYAPNLGKQEAQGSEPSFPAVELEFSSGNELARYQAYGRFPGLLIPTDKRDRPPAGLGDLHVWYNFDPRFDNDKARGALQFVASDDAKNLYYRAFSVAADANFSLEAAGEAQTGISYPIWQKMKWRFQVTEFLPNAIAKTRFVPENHRPGLDREDLSAALRCRLSVGRESQEFWLSLTDERSTPVHVGGTVYRVGFNLKAEELPFSLKLLRAEQGSDFGGNAAASFTSWVELTDPENKIKSEPHVITMNAPLEYRGYKFYQSGFQLLGPDANLRPVTRSTFSVGRDPGLSMKYLGSIMLALGIVCMFYMKAYFFKPRGRAMHGAAA